MNPVVKHIEKQCATVARVTVSDLHTSSNRHDIVLGRSLAMFVIKTLVNGLTHSQIGTYFGRSHGNVSQSIRNIRTSPEKLKLAYEIQGKAQTFINTNHFLQHQEKISREERNSLLFALWTFLIYGRERSTFQISINM